MAGRQGISSWKARVRMGEMLHHRAGGFKGALATSCALWNHGSKSASLRADRFIDFSRPCTMYRAAILLATLLIALVGSAAAQPDRPGAQSPVAPKSKAAPRSPPMTFYLAKGDEGVCGPGCSEWIAAEGQIEANSAQQLRAFLGRLGKRKLPIFFHSPGGNVTTSTVMGRLLRERDMTAGVSETMPLACAGAS